MSEPAQDADGQVGDTLADDVTDPDDETFDEAAFDEIEVVVAANEDARLDALMRALSDADWRVRRAAASSIPAEDYAAIAEPLYDLLASEDAGARNAAIKAFVRIGSPALSYLLPGLQAPDQDVRNFCVLAVGLIGDHAATLPLVEAMRTEKDPNVEYMIMEALGRLGDPAGVPCLMQALDREPWIKAPAVDALGRMRCSEAVTALISVLEDEVVGGVAAEALGRMGDVRATLPLVKATGSATGFAVEVHLTALAETLTSCGQGGPLLHTTLLPLVSDEERHALAVTVSRALTKGRVTHAALTVAEWLDDPDTLPAVISAMEDVSLHDQGLRVTARLLSRSTPEWIARTGSAASSHAKQVLLEAIAIVGAGGRGAWIAEDLEDPNPLIAAASARALGAVGQAGDAADIVPLLGHPLDEVRRAAAEGIARLGADLVARELFESACSGSPLERAAVASCLAQRAGWSEGRLVDALTALAGDEDETVRQASARAIGTAPAKSAETLAELLAEDPAPAVRRTVVDSLSRLQRPCARALLATMARDQDPGVRVAALNALAAHSSQDDRVLFEDSLPDADPRVRIAALGGLAAVGRRDSVPSIRLVLDEQNPDVYCAALRALATADPAEAEAMAVGAMLSADWRLRAASVDLLRRVGGASAQDAIRRALNDEDAAVRSAAIAACPRVLGRDGVAELLSLLDDDRAAGEAEDALLQVACDSRDDVLPLLADATGRRRSALLRIAASTAAGEESVLLPLLSSESAEDRFYAVLGLSHGSAEAIWAVKEAARAPQELGVEMVMTAVVAARAHAGGGHA